MKTQTFEFRLKLLSPASHIGVTLGVEAAFHRLDVIVDGAVERVPCFTGNSLRGQLRDAGAAHLVRTLGLDALPLKSFYLLFSGGSLEKGLSVMSLEQARRLRSLLPFLSLFGGASGNHIMAGRWSSSFIVPIARETRFMTNVESDVSVYDLLRTIEYTRMDDAKDVRLEALVEGGEMGKVLKQLDTKREKQLADTPGTAQQMRYRVEVMVAGAELSWRAAFVNASDLELQAFWACLATWGERPCLGGKVGTGHGAVELVGGDVYIAPTRVVVPSFEAYEAHLRAHRDAICEILYG